MQPTANTKWWIFIGAGLMIFLVNVDATIVNLALAQIAKGLQTNLSQIQWVINAYLLTTAIFFMVGGKLSDNYSAKPIFLTGTVCFGLASLIAGLAFNIDILIFARLLQGVGFAFTLSLALIMIAQSFPPNQRGFALGLSITLTGLGQAIGPTLGGVILNELNWHWIFLINIPITIASFIIIFLYSNPKASNLQKQPVDYLGIILFGIVVIILLLTFNLLTAANINLSLFISGLVGNLILFVIFYYKERRTKNPLIDFHLFSIRDYSLSLLIRFLFMYIYGTFLFFIPLLLQNILGFSPIIAGLILLVYSSLFGIFGPMSGIWADQVGYRAPIIASASICGVAFILLALIYPQMISPNKSLYILLLGMLLFGLAAGVLIPCTVNSTLSSLPQKNAGEGLGMFFTIAFIGTSLGVAIGGVQLNFIAWHTFISNFPYKLNLTAPQLEVLHHIANGTRPLAALSQSFDYAQMMQFVGIAKTSFMKGFASVMCLNLVFSLIIIFLSIILKKPHSTPR